MEVGGTYLFLLAAGLVAGVINVIAGGGSFITLPILIFLGVPPGVANATNRVGIVAQDLAAVWSFDRKGVLDRRAAVWAAVPATVGAGLGAWLALRTSDALFLEILPLLMVALSLGSLWMPRRPSGGEARSGSSIGPLPTLGFFLAGVYGGFVQAGVGFLFLALTSILGLDLVRGNAVKVLSILPLTALALAIFAWDGRVEWLTGGVLALGFLAGGLFGARLTVLKGHRWVRAVVTATILVFALELLLAP
ncbi:MAG: TSUP family transporter [Acidobacteria bacterium]|nr:TSUP family transporter [Acidobacteriota bacterium]